MPCPYIFRRQAIRHATSSASLRSSFRSPAVPALKASRTGRPAILWKLTISGQSSSRLPMKPISSSSRSQNTESNLRKILLKTPMRVFRIAFSLALRQARVEGDPSCLQDAQRYRDEHVGGVEAAAVGEHVDACARVVDLRDL